MEDRYVVLRNGKIFQYCDSIRRARRCQRVEQFKCKVLRAPASFSIVKESDLRDSIE